MPCVYCRVMCVCLWNRIMTECELAKARENEEFIYRERYKCGRQRCKQIDCVPASDNVISKYVHTYLFGADGDRSE